MTTASDIGEKKSKTSTIFLNKNNLTSAEKRAAD